MLELHRFWRGAFDSVRNSRRQQYESVLLKLDGQSAIDMQCANACQAVMQACRLAGVEAQSPAIAYVADCEMSYTDVKRSQKMIQDHVRI